MNVVLDLDSERHGACDAIHVEAVSLVSRDAAGRDMRLIEVSQLLEPRHDAANRRRAERRRQLLRHRHRAYRHTTRNILADDHRQDFTLPPFEIAFTSHPLSSSLSAD